MVPVRAAVFTCPRQTKEGQNIDYLPDTMKSALSSDEFAKPEIFTIMSDSVDKPTYCCPGVRVQTCTPEEVQWVKKRNVRSTFNRIIFQRWAAARAKLVCVLEDDLRFASGWLTKALRFAEVLEKTNKPWVLALMHFYSHTSHLVHFEDVNQAGELLRWDQQGALWGSQAYLMNRQTALTIARIYEEKITTLPDEKRPYWVTDNGMWRMCSILHAFDFYVPKPSLVQHIGTVSVAWPKQPPEWKTTRHFEKNQVA